MSNTRPCFGSVSYTHLDVYKRQGEIHRDLFQLKKDYESGRSLKSTRTAAVWSPRRKLRLAGAAALALAIVAAGVWGPRLLHRVRSAAGTAASIALEKKSIAVLPFAAIADDPKPVSYTHLDPHQHTNGSQTKSARYIA